MTFTVISQSNETLFFESNNCHAFQIRPTLDWTDPAYWQSINAIEKTAIGRGITYFVKAGDQILVLRHYRRGGLVRHLSHDKFIYTGLENTRAWKELSLLRYMQDRDLPVPLGIAGFIRKKGFTYESDIITVCIPDTVDMHTKLTESKVVPDTWYKIGTTVKQLHEAQIFHSDLNIHNILQDKDNKIWIIDFDKCKHRQGDGWKKDNIERLKRSLFKENRRNEPYFFENKNWSDFEEGYNQNL